MKIDAISEVGYWLHGRRPAVLSKFCCDYRALSDGDCFLALPIDGKDGHDFVDHAREMGASCALLSKPLPSVDLPQLICDSTELALGKIAKIIRSRFRGTVISISGCCAAGNVASAMLSAILGVKSNDVCKDSIAVQLAISSLSNGENFAIIAVDCAALNGAICDLIAPDVALIADSMCVPSENWSADEASMRRECAMVSSALANGGYGVFHEDCLSFECFRSVCSRCRVLTESDSDIGYTIDAIGEGSYRVALRFCGDIFNFTLHKFGDYAAARAFLLVCVCAIECGIAAEQIVERIAQFCA
jgi:UDP-N-acetylmuramyl pentapeptide synthase